MSVAAREVLIKSVAQAQLTYPMQVFRIPDEIINDIHSLMASFWWGQKGDEQRIHWTRREKIACAKVEGGMGFCDLTCFNIALLAKQLWKLYQRPESLIAWMLKAKYHKHSTVLEAEIGYRPSFIWRSLLGVHDLLWKGLRWRVGDGCSVKI
ncbi:Uncharacterized mitochondrial protein AtMg00310 [Linum grandiflorum]